MEFVIDGLNVGLEANGSAVKAIGGRGGLVQFLDSVTWFGGNPSGWTTDVIRLTTRHPLRRSAVLLPTAVAWA